MAEIPYIDWSEGKEIGLRHSFSVNMLDEEHIKGLDSALVVYMEKIEGQRERLLSRDHLDSADKATLDALNRRIHFCNQLWQVFLAHRDKPVENHQIEVRNEH